MTAITRRSILALVPRVEAHPTHAVIDGVTYPGGLAQYEAHCKADERLERAMQEARSRAEADERLRRLWHTGKAQSRYEQTLGGWA